MTTKLNIAKQISSNTCLSVKLSIQIIDSFINIIKTNSVRQTIKIKDFGIFKTQRTAKRIGRNPKSRESYIIQPRKKLVYKASKKTREAIN